MFHTERTELTKKECKKWRFKTKSKKRVLNRQDAKIAKEDKKEK